MSHVAVIGGGIVGLACGWAMARAGWAVDLYTASTLASGSTGAAAGMLAPGIEGLASGMHPDLPAALHASRTLWDSWHADLCDVGAAPPPLEGRGTLVLGAGDDDAGQWIDHLRGQGARYFSDDRRIDPRGVCAALGRAIVRAGGRVHLHAPQTALTGLADQVIWAGGAEGLHDLACLSALIPIRGQGVRCDAPSPPLMLRGHGVYVAPDGVGCYVGATMQPGVRDLTPDPAITADLIARAALLWPAVAQASHHTAVVGIRPGTPDHAPLLGRVSPQVVVATGAHRNGILLAPYMATQVRDMLMDGVVPPFDPQRFVPAV